MDFIGGVAKSLAEIGYQGDCLELEHLRYAVRVGACSWQYLELVNWLEQQFIDCNKSAVSTAMVEFDFAPLFMELRSSFLKISTGGSSDPSELRWTILEYLINVLKMAYTKQRSSTPVVGRMQRPVDGESSSLSQDEVGESRNSKESESLQLLKDAQDPTEDRSEGPSEAYDTDYFVRKCMDVYNSINHGAVLQYLIISNAIPTGEISRSAWRRIKTLLQQHFITPEAENIQITAAEANGIYFDKFMHNNQLRVVVCQNAISAELLRLSVEQLPREEQVSLLPYCKESHDAFVLTAWILIGKTFKDSSMLLDLIALHNSLNTESWHIIKSEPAAGSCGHHYLFKLDRSILPFLDRNGGRLNFGQSQLYVRLNKELRADFDFLSLKMGSYARYPIAVEQ